MPSVDVAAVRYALLGWYDGAARALPWRGSRDPYAIWVSEIMLQQTRVDTVLRYYDRFLSRFPTPEALAQASEDEVLAAWSGLGYYRRARLLQQGVREVVARYGGQVPREPEARRALPGVGRYTAGAIGSIAFDLPEPIVDGNVARVLCRVLALDGPVESKAVQDALWDAAAALARGPRAGALNQALMELGATVCSKSAPACDGCPLVAHCRARALGKVEQLPRARIRKAPVPTPLVALVARTAAGALYLRRGERGTFAGLWNLPMLDGKGRAAARALCEQEGLPHAQLARAPAARVEHVLSHRHLKLELWPLARAEAAEGSALRAVQAGELAVLGISQLTRKAIAAVESAMPPIVAPAMRTRAARRAR
jgi:A/G-specific adenine glycosylase